MSVYFVDYENIRAAGLKGINSLSGDETVYVFYSNNYNVIPIDVHKKLLTCAAKVEFICVSVGGKNALDFQLSTFLGSIVAVAPDEDYRIVSNDTGFKYIVEFWKAKNIRLSLVRDLNRAEAKPAEKSDGEADEKAEEAPDEKPAEEKSEEPQEKVQKKKPARRNTKKPAQKAEPTADDAEKLKADIEALFSEEDIRHTLLQFIAKYKTKSGIYSALVKKYTEKNGLEIYNKIKPLLKNKK